MNTRDQFEAAWRKEYPLHGATAFKRSGVNPDAYVNTRVQDGWLMWQAGRQSASATRQEPVLTVKDADEYGPIIEWKKHWVELIGANLYAAPIGDNGANFAIYRDVESGLLVLIDSFDGTSSSVRIGSIRESRPLKDFVDAQPAESRRVELSEGQVIEAIQKACGEYRHGCSYSFEDVWNCIEVALLASAQAKGER